MITQGPFDLTIGTELPLSDPGATSNNPATAVQIQNASPFIVEINAGGTVLTLQSFTAQTVPTSGGGQQMSVVPIESNVSSVTTATRVLTVVWLLPGESAPMLDGPLTAAAIVFASTLTNYNVGGGSQTGTTVVPMGGTVNMTSSAPPSGKCYRIQMFWEDLGSGSMIIGDSSTGAPLSLLHGPGSLYMGGQLCFGKITVTNQGSMDANAGVTYDTITIPVSP